MSTTAPTADALAIESQLTLMTEAICGMTDLVDAMRPYLFDPASREVGGTLFARLCELCDASLDIVNGFNLHGPVSGLDDIGRVVLKHAESHQVARLPLEPRG